MSQTEVLHKFPRTYHLFEVKKGRMAREDLVLDRKDAEPFYNSVITVEEKIDGSNLGFSLDPETLQVRAQNRSHFVTCQSHSQFRALDSWISEHPKLYEVLSPNYILFGEWMSAKHSISYNHLPGLFVAFDIFDTKNQKFLSVTERNARLKGTGIPIIRCVAHGFFPNEESLMALMTQNSVYTIDKHTVPLEGIYIRVDDETTGFLKYRAKIVRSDFIQTVDDSSHWSTQVVVKNEVDYEWKMKIEYNYIEGSDIHNGNIPVIKASSSSFSDGKCKKK